MNNINKDELEAFRTLLSNLADRRFISIISDYIGESKKEEHHHTTYKSTKSFIDDRKQIIDLLVDEFELYVNFIRTATMTRGGNKYYKTLDNEDTTENSTLRYGTNYPI